MRSRIDELQTLANVMQQSSNQKCTPAQVGNTIRVRVPDIDRARMDSQSTSISAAVIDVDNDFYAAGTKHWVTKYVNVCNEFSVGTRKKK
jgi:hypothetical protein